jgi:uncharacterized protein
MTPRPYADPYIAGVGLGLVLLACFALTGQGLGASGAFASVASGTLDVLAPRDVADNAWVRGYVRSGAPWTAWMVIEVLGAIIGAAVSAVLAGRFRRTGVHVGPGRLGGAAIGGMLMGVGAALARGCTSGLALSGGALLSVGAWVFMLALFAGGFLAAPLLRRLWA